MTSTRTPRRADFEQFFTCRYPERFKIDWRTFYARAQAETDRVRARWPHVLDVHYGPHPQQRLDLYLPFQLDGTTEAAPATPNGAAARPRAGGVPLVLFLHGGGFREGDPALYGYLAEPYLARGVIFASVGYRLTPESYLPETMLDAEDAVAWCMADLRSRGLSPAPVILAGHSAGAILTAHLAMRTDWLEARGLPADLLYAAVPISGVYDFTDPNNHAEFFRDAAQTNAAQRAAASPLRLPIPTHVPRLLVAYGEHENRADYGVDSQRLVEAVTAGGGQAQLLQLKGLDHSETATALADEHSPLFQAVAALLVTASDAVET